MRGYIAPPEVYTDDEDLFEENVPFGELNLMYIDDYTLEDCPF